MNQEFKIGDRVEKCLGNSETVGIVIGQAMSHTVVGRRILVVSIISCRSDFFELWEKERPIPYDICDFSGIVLIPRGTIMTMFDYAPFDYWEKIKEDATE